MNARLQRIAGPVVVAIGLEAKMHDVVMVGKERLLGEVIQIDGEKTVIQVYEDTSGVRPGEPIENTEKPLSVSLGPGLLASIYDGVQRPLPSLLKETGDFITRGASIEALDTSKKWKFTATAELGMQCTGGEIIGHVDEISGFKHNIMVPPGVSGKLQGLKSGSYTVTEPIGKIGDKNIFLKQEWPVRLPRPVKEKRAPSEPLVTGQRIIDSLFPIAKGGTAIIPGPFGAGKTVAMHSLAKWADADIVIYVGCGERGNEMTEVLTEFPELKDPRNDNPLMHRTVLIANTSNMPVAAREASIYTGITIAEYFRDMGYNVALMADSTSRWAEALREISSRLEEMPGEEGYPAYIGSRLAEFYERASPVLTLSGKESSLSVMGAVSPPGGDFFEPVTQASLRVAKVFWALDSKLAQQRHFPSINWLESYSLYKEPLRQWYDQNVDEEWHGLIEDLSRLLQDESELQEIVQLVGSDALPEDQQLTLKTARLVREVLLQQSAFDDLDQYTKPKHIFMMMKLIMLFHSKLSEKLKDGKKLQEIDDKISSKLNRYKRSQNPEDDFSKIKEEIEAS